MGIQNLKRTGVTKIVSKLTNSLFCQQELSFTVLHNFPSALDTFILIIHFLNLIPHFIVYHLSFLIDWQTVSIFYISVICCIS